MRIRVAFAYCSTRTGRIRCTAWRERRDRSRCRSSRELLTLCGVLRASTELALLPNATLRRMLTSTALTSTTPLVDAPPLGPSRHSPRSRPPQRPHIRPAIRASRVARVRRHRARRGGGDAGGGVGGGEGPGKEGGRGSALHKSLGKYRWVAQLPAVGCDGHRAAAAPSRTTRTYRTTRTMACRGMGPSRARRWASGVPVGAAQV